MKQLSFKKIFFHICILFLLFLSFGCSAQRSPLVDQNVNAAVTATEIDSKEPIEPVVENKIPVRAKSVVIKKGMVFAKTDFQGVLKSNYVKLLIENLNDSTKKIQLHVGDRANQGALPWEVKTIQPGYFFIELPAGKYKMATISIPVGSTLATEEMNVMFEVKESKISYLGTLRAVGTKETIKFGGVPIFKPGFEYKVEIVDESIEGIQKFRELYPQVNDEISVNLMQLNLSQISRQMQRRILHSDT